MINQKSQNQEIKTDISFLTFLKSLIISISFLGALYLILLRVDQYLRNTAVDNCSKNTKYEENIKDKNIKVIYPVLDQYKICIKDKGYEK